MISAKPTKKHRGVYEHPHRSGVWWILYYDQYGQRHREKVGLKSAAITQYRRRKTEVAQKKFNPEDIEGKHHHVAVAEVIDDYIGACERAGCRALKDIRLRALYWKNRWPDRAAKSISPGDIELARMELAEGRHKSNWHKTLTGSGRAVSTVNRYVATLKAAFSVAMRNGKVDTNPGSQVKLPKENNKRTRWLTKEEEVRLLAVMPDEYHPLVLVALHTGMRKHEQLNLKWADIDFQRRLIYIPVTKSGIGRHVHMNDVVIETLQRLPRMLHNAHVFYGRKPGEPLHNGIKNSDWKRYLRKAGIEDFHWHDLRHTFASRLVMKGIDLYTVSKLLGHSALEVTERYAHLASAHLQKAVNSLAIIQQPSEQPLTESNIR
jgi:integrase